MGERERVREREREREKKQRLFSIAINCETKNKSIYSIHLKLWNCFPIMHANVGPTIEPLRGFRFLFFQGRHRLTSGIVTLITAVSGANISSRLIRIWLFVPKNTPGDI